MADTKINRRDFLSVGAGAAAVGLAGERAHADDTTEKPTSRVVLIRSQEVLGTSGRPDPQILHRMLNDGLARLFEEETAAAVWKKLFSPSDVVGIKSNEWGRLPTPAALEKAMRAELEGIGIAPENIAVEDRGVRSNAVFKRATAMINTRPRSSAPTITPPSP